MKMTKKNIALETLEWAGSLLILIGYFSLVQGYLFPTDIEYLMLNILGSGFLGTSLVVKKAYGGSFLQLVFVGISLWGIIKYFGI